MFLHQIGNDTEDVITLFGLHLVYTIVYPKWLIVEYLFPSKHSLEVRWVFERFIHYYYAWELGPTAHTDPEGLIVTFPIYLVFPKKLKVFDLANDVFRW